MYEGRDKRTKNNVRDMNRKKEEMKGKWYEAIKLRMRRKEKEVRGEIDRRIERKGGKGMVSGSDVQGIERLRGG